jgi:hypothetical protein
VTALSLAGAALDQLGRRTLVTLAALVGMAAAAAWVAVGLRPRSELAVAAGGMTLAFAAELVAVRLRVLLRAAGRVDEQLARAQARLNSLIAREAEERTAELERVLARARAEAAVVEGRLRSAARLTATNRGELEEDLRKDRARLARVQGEAAEHYREIEARLQIIEAMADRDASQAETELALRRLGSVRENLPLGLASLRLEQDAREEVEKELRVLSPPATAGENEPDADARSNPPQSPGA